MLIVIIVLVIGGIIAGKKVKEMGIDFEGSPEKTAAELVISFNPEYEKVSSDEENQEMTIDFEGSPEKTAAELVISFNPEYEKVSSDEENQEMTIRDKSGNETTVKFADIMENRFDRAAVDIPDSLPTE